MKNRLHTLGLALLLSACASAPTVVQDNVAARSDADCDTGVFAVSDDFVGARRGDCEIVSSRAVRLKIVREDASVRNPSPWYAFKVVAKKEATVRITLDYGSWNHRYVPKISRDGKTFAPAPEALYASPKKNLLELTFVANTEPVWIAAQPLITPEHYETKLKALAGQTGVELSVAGRSLADLPIYQLESGIQSNKLILLTGRQHPPEVTGAVSMMTFLDTIYADTKLATQFRSAFRVISLPLMNPDGVVAGHWRHNLGSTDLNRDWGPFTQPETQIVKRLLDQLDAQDVQVVAFADFHSMDRSLVYSQAEPTKPEGFTAIWLARSLAKIRADAEIDYPFENEPRASSATANGKNYMYKRYGIPSLTFEVGDETATADNQAAARIFAAEFMRLALERL